MNIGIDINFFEPGSPDEAKQGRLFIDEDGKDYLEIAGTWTDAFGMIKVIHAEEKDSEERYTLINCFFRQYISGTCRYLINELYKGDFLDKVSTEDCIEVDAQMTGLTNWINYPRIKPEITFSSAEKSKVIIKEFFTVSFPISKKVKLELWEFCGESYTRNETVLRNLSRIKFVCQEATSRLELHKNVIGFLQLLSIFTDELPKMTSLNFILNNGKTIEHLTTKKQKGLDENEALLSYEKMETYWPVAIEIFYGQREKFVRVLDLLIASIRNNTPEISFLNITTAYEVFHKYFQEDNNDSARKQIAAELVTVGLISRDSGKWDQIVRYYHLFKLTNGIEFFRQNFKNPQKTMALLRDSRNYYTHYSSTEKEIWTPNKLLFANKALRQLLKAVILKELKIPEELINKLLNNRAAVIYQDFENNEYSLRYLSQSKDYQDS